MNNIQRIVFTFFVLGIFLCRNSYGYVNTVNDYYKNVLEPKLDILCEATMKEAVKIANTHQPVFETTLTREERYFSSDSMQFFTGQELQEARYSGVKKLAVWVHGLTLIKGWTQDGKTYKVNYVYTRDARFETLSGINAFGDTTALEKFCNDSLYNISAEYGSVGHLQTVFANDDWSAVCVLVSYSENTIKSIEAWDDNAYGDKVPIVPKSKNMEVYIEDTKRQIDWEAEHAIELSLAEIRRRENNLSYREKSPVDTKIDTETDVKLSATEIVTISLSLGIIISLIAVFTYKGFSDNSTSTTQAQRNSNPKEPNQEKKQEAEYINAEFTEETSAEDFDYPYEDIGDALR